MRLAPLVACALALSCRTVSAPEQVAEDYARALRDDRLDQAYALTTADFRSQVSREAFAERYADEARRRERAEAILAALPEMRARAAGLEASREEAGWRVAEIPPTEGPREALARFLDAAEAGDFAAAYGMLAGPLRARYTAERLEADFNAEPLARERLIRARAALSVEPVWRGEAAEFPLGGGNAVRLVREGGAFKVASLE